MANFYPSLNADLRAFIAEQHIFFTASATADGRINLSPKGMESFLCLDDQTAAYLNVTGSGNETATLTVLLKDYEVLGNVGELTMFNATLAVTGAVTWS